MTALMYRSTPARAQFKSLVGQNNHFLITILVGLSAVEKGEASLPSDFSTSWNPQSVSTSAHRSRLFAQRSLLSWTVDALDLYLKGIVRQFPHIAPTDLWKDPTDGRSRGTGERLALFGSRAGVLPVYIGMVELAVVWRNRTIHSDGRNKVAAATAARLRNAEDQIHDLFQGLDISLALTHVTGEPTSPPTFKEVASIVRAAQKYVELVDQFVVDSVDLDGVLESIIRDYLVEDGHDFTQRATKLWGRGPLRASKSIEQIAVNSGMTWAVPTAGDRTVSPNFIEELSQICLLYTSPSPRDRQKSRMPSSA